MLTGALALIVAGSSGWAQGNVEEALKRPIAESGLLKELDQPAAIGAAPRAVAVSPRTTGAKADSAAAVAEPAKKAKGPTEITAMQATFDNRKHQAVFENDVTVNDPEFSVTCDKLTAFLKHEEPAADGAKPAVKTPVVSKEASEKNDDGGKKKGGLDRAIAEGHVVIRQEKLEADGSTSQSTGKAARADYDARTGDIVLTGRPIVQQGLNMCIATADETVMTLNRDRNMKVLGPHRTIISDKADLEK